MAAIPGTQRVLGSLLFNMEVDGGPQASAVQHADQHRGSIQASCERLAAYVRPLPGFPTKLLRDVKRLKASILEDEERVDAVLLAAMLSERGYSVLVRCALGGAGAGAPGSCFRNLRHEFVFVRCESGDYEGVELMVDPNFREQFAIPQPTEAFSALLQAVPEEFVGTSVRLHPVVELICAEMAASFEARGLTIPPWRRAAAMMSKWMPAKARDIPVDSAGESPRDMSPPCIDATVPLLFPTDTTGWKAVSSPERRLQEAAQQLQTLALHSQQQASPTHILQLLAPQLAQQQLPAGQTVQPVQSPAAPAPVQAASTARSALAPLPEDVACLPIEPIVQQALQQQWLGGGGVDLNLLRAPALDSLFRHSDTCFPLARTSAMLPSAELTVELGSAAEGSVSSAMFARHSEPALNRQRSQVSLLSVQLATARPASPAPPGAGPAPAPSLGRPSYPQPRTAPPQPSAPPAPPAAAAAVGGHVFNTTPQKPQTDPAKFAISATNTNVTTRASGPSVSQLTPRPDGPIASSAAAAPAPAIHSRSGSSGGDVQPAVMVPGLLPPPPAAARQPWAGPVIHKVRYGGSGNVSPQVASGSG